VFAKNGVECLIFSPKGYSLHDMNVFAYESMTKRT